MKKKTPCSSRWSASTCQKLSEQTFDKNRFDNKTFDKKGGTFSRELWSCSSCVWSTPPARTCRRPRWSGSRASRRRSGGLPWPSIQHGRWSRMEMDMVCYTLTMSELAFDQWPWDWAPLGPGLGDLHEAPCEKCWAGLGFPLHDGPRLRQHHLVLLPPPGEKGPYSTQKCVFSSHWSATKGEPFQGVTESTLGLLTGLSAVMGVAGARIFPIARLPNYTCLKMRRDQGV